MASLFHRAKQRRAERAPLTAHGSINLVPLVDILTSIVFFSLLTYTGATMAALTSFDLSLPPVVVTAPGDVKQDDPLLNLLLAVRIQSDKLLVEHSEEGGFKREIRGITPESLEQLQTLMADIRARYPQNKDVLVVPSDEISYESVVSVLERVKLAGFSAISLGSRARATQVASAGGR